MSRHAGSQRGILLLVTLTVALAATLALGLDVGSIATETTEEPDLESVGSGGGAVYVTDTDATAYENEVDLLQEVIAAWRSDEPVGDTENNALPTPRPTLAVI